MAKQLDKTEIELLNEDAQKLVQGFRMFDIEEFGDAVRAAYQANAHRKEIQDARGKPVMAKLVRYVVTSPKRDGYGVPFPWWWISFEHEVLKGVDYDPWSEVRWWLFEEIRGKGKVLTMWGAQNCLEPSTLVRMWNGSVKRADEVAIGDRLMGDDSTVRKVTSVCAGQAPMVRVTPKVGKPFVCTENHLVTVVCKRGIRNHGGRGGWNSAATPGSIYDIEASRLAAMSPNRAQCYGLISAATEYPEADLPHDPYIYGLWLGDGTKSKAEITSADREILNAWSDYFTGIGLVVKESANNHSPGVMRSLAGCPDRSMHRRGGNPWMNFVRTSVDGSKFIRRDYLTSSSRQRLELLAGLIDTDGHLEGGVYYSLCCSDLKLMDGYEELANSLGFRTTRKQKATNYKGSDGEVRMTEILSICGDIARIPVRLERKKKQRPAAGRGVRKHGVTGFTVEPIGVGDFAGFEVDGNHRFLLADYTVTHNSGKSSWMGRFAIIQMVAWTGDAVVYATGPKKLHSEDKSWADTVEVLAKYLQSHKNNFIAALGIKVHVGKHLVEISDEAGKATAKFVSSEDSSTIRGKKSHSHDTSGLRGITLVLVDEFVENPHLDLRGINQNSSSNYNYCQLMGCNPNPELVSHPNLRDFSFPNKVANLDRTRNFRWETPYGLCVRFAWQNSPNNTIGRTRWPYLTDAIRVERQREKGATAIDAEIDAWGFGSGARGAPLDEARIKLAGTYEEPMWNGPTTRIAVFDCAFGGQDPATAFIAECGPSFFKDRSGGRFTRETIAAIDQIVIPVQQEFEVTADWLDEMEELMTWTGGKWPEAVSRRGVQVGDKLNGNYSMAYGALKTLRDYSVRPEHCTFDSSQRGDCTSIMLDFLGRKNIRWFYEGNRKLVDEEEMTRGWAKYPYEYVADESSGSGKRAVQWSERCTAVISAIWFQACELISRGHLSNGDHCKKGLLELCSRPVTKRRNATEGKIDVISKDELKKMGMASPTYAETLAIGIMFATRILKLIKVDEPETSVFSAAAPASTAFIRSGQSRVFRPRKQA